MSTEIGDVFDVNLADGHPIYRQIYGRLRQAIMSGSMPGGCRLPSIRVLAAQLGVARNTVLSAYDQLLAEGCLEARAGSGHYVVDLSPERAPRAHGLPRKATPATRRPSSAVHNFGFVHANFITAMPMRPFRPNMPSIEAEHMQSWTRCYGRVLREAGRTPGRAGFLGESDAAGESRLRHAIAEYVSLSRGVRCTADQIVVTAGSQHAVDLLLRVIAEPGDNVAIEDPSFLGSLAAFQAAGLRPIPVPVDNEGMDVSQVVARRDNVRLALICPSSQYPLGHVMAMQRRLALIEWAHRTGAWIIEDDYDSEYRYAGPPIPSLQGLDGGNRVIYIGTFSKVLFPALRIGFIVAPQELVEPLTAVRAVSGRHGSAIDQEALARFILDGHLGRHIRRMRRIYRERLEALRANCERYLKGFLELDSAVSGLQLIGWLPPGADDAEFSRQASEGGIELPNLSRYCVAMRRPPAVLLGFGAFSETEATAGIRALAGLVDQLAANGACQRGANPGHWGGIIAGQARRRPLAKPTFR